MAKYAVAAPKRSLTTGDLTSRPNHKENTVEISANRSRVVDLFVELARIRSPKPEYGAIQAHLADLVRREFGVEPQFDRAGSALPGFEQGNLYFNIPATPGCEHLPVIGFDAHVDTVPVPPGKLINVVVDGDMIRTDGTTILGGDDKSGVAAIVEALRLLKETGVPHGPIQVFFTVGEEYSMYGVKALDRDVAKANRIVCFDGLDSSVVWLSCAAKLKYRARFLGKEGHGGFPEQGLSAILMAVKALDHCRKQELMGRINDYGVIRGTAPDGSDSVWHNVAEIISDPNADLKRHDRFPSTNVIPADVVVTGELRAFDKDALERVIGGLRETFEKAASGSLSGNSQITGRVEIELERPYDPFRLPDDHPLVLEVLAAMRKADVPNARAEITQGATHANIFNMWGIPTVVVGSGIRDPHMNSEYLLVPEMVKAAEVLVHLVAKTE